MNVEITPDGSTYSFGTRNFRNRTNWSLSLPSPLLPPFIIECFHNSVREENQHIPLLQINPCRRIICVCLYAKRQATGSLSRRLCRLGSKPKRAGMACKAQLGIEFCGINDANTSR